MFLVPNPESFAFFFGGKTLPLTFHQRGKENHGLKSAQKGGEGEPLAKLKEPRFWKIHVCGFAEKSVMASLSTGISC